MNRVRLLMAVVTLVVAAAVGWAPAAHASAYRYWTYWIGTDDEWSFATAGPASLIPEDGSVNGWRFAVTTAAGAAAQPRAAASFDQICATTAAENGKKRVALVIDPGEPGDAPEGQAPGGLVSRCVVAELDATGYQVLRSVVQVRVDKGLVCGIDGYPTGECAPVVDDPTPAASGPSPLASTGAASASPSEIGASSAMDTSGTTPPDSGGSPWAVVAVAAFVALIVGTFFWRRHRA